MIRKFLRFIVVISVLFNACSAGIENNEVHNSRFGPPPPPPPSAESYPTRPNDYNNIIENVRNGVGMLNTFLGARNGLLSMEQNRNGPPVVPVNNNYLDNQNDIINDNGDRNGNGRTWLQSAQNFINGPGGQMALSMAKEFVSRSGGNQVLSLNLSNLLILVLLKALIFGAGLIGAGGSYYGRARGLEDNFLDSRDVQLFLGFLATEGSGQEGCLYKAACEAPTKATEYLKAGRALLQGTEMIDSSMPYNAHYTAILQNLEQAISEGMQDADCEMIYACHM